MNFKNLALIGAALLLSSPVFATTYYGGFEDLSSGPRSASDYDYNDVIFSLSGTGLQLQSHGDSFYAKPSVDQSGRPFWDNVSWDGQKMNVGYCIYGGGNCGSGIDANAQFLASNPNSPKGSANNVTFHVDGTVNATLLLNISAADDEIGYYLLSDPTKSFHAVSATSDPNLYTFTPNGDFGLIGLVGDTMYYSQTFLGACDDQSHFAFFSSSAPEPGMMSLMGAGLIGIGTLVRRKRTAKS
jgi:hypothetical protein